MSRLIRELEELREELARYKTIFEETEEDHKFRAAFKAPPQVAATIKALYYAEYLSPAALHAIAEEHGKSNGRDSDYPKMMIFRARQHLKKHRIKVKSFYKHGYAVNEDDKQKIWDVVSGVKNG